MFLEVLTFLATSLRISHIYFDGPNIIIFRILTLVEFLDKSTKSFFQNQFSYIIYGYNSLQFMSEDDKMCRVFFILFFVIKLYQYYQIFTI